MIGGIELVADKKTKRAFAPAGPVGVVMAERSQANGVIVRNMIDTIGLCPPFIISEAEIDELFDRVTKSLDETLDHLTKNGLAAVA